MKRMFKKLILFLSVLSFCFYVGCSEKEPADNPKPLIPKDTVYYSSDGGTKEIDALLGGEYSCQASWIVVTPNGDGSKISVAVQPSQLIEIERTAEITVSVNGEVKKIILIWQEGAENPLLWKVLTDTVYIASKGEVREINVSTGILGYTDFLWDESWVDIESLNHWDTEIVVTLQPNSSATERTSLITVTTKGEVRTKILIWQYGKRTLTPTSAPYSIGDIYFENGIAGVVYKVTNNGMNGMIVALTGTYCEWATKYEETGATDLYNGVNNMNAVKQIENWQSYYPPFVWCESLNTGGVTGWYIPSINEMADLYAGFSGLSKWPGGADADAPTKYKAARKKFNETILLYDGDRIEEKYQYFCSTAHKTNAGTAWFFDFGYGVSSDDPQKDFTNKMWRSRFRAVRPF
jgi:hypothetical protein